MRKVPLFCKKRLSGLVDIACADGQDDIARLRILAQIGRHALQARTVDRAGDLRGQLLRADTDGVLFTRGVNIGQNDLVGRAQLVDKAVNIIESMGARVIGPAEVREKLKLTKRAPRG